MQGLTFGGVEEEPTIHRLKRIEDSRRTRENIVKYALMLQVVSV